MDSVRHCAWRCELLLLQFSPVIAASVLQHTLLACCMGPARLLGENPLQGGAVVESLACAQS